MLYKITTYVEPIMQVDINSWLKCKTWRDTLSNTIWIRVDEINGARYDSGPFTDYAL